MNNPLPVLRSDSQLGNRCLHGTPASRRIEAAALATTAPGQLMAQAGAAVARLAWCLAPHARRVRVLCGPGNNGGDGWVAAQQLHQHGWLVEVSELADAVQLPPDAAAARRSALAAGVSARGDWPTGEPEPDVLIDGLLGLGQQRPPQGRLADWIARANRLRSALVLAIDVPTGLCSDSGRVLGDQAIQAAATLSLLTLKPGLFTHQGRDHCGDIWFSGLGCDAFRKAQAGDASLSCQAEAQAVWCPRAHAQHKGSFGDVWVIGGAPGMAGAAWLAASAALAGGAGRVYLSLLGAKPPETSTRAELMLRHTEDWQHDDVLEQATVVCGCGGDATVADTLPDVLRRARRLVLDADALNAIAADDRLALSLRSRRGAGLVTVLTPHPLEAARLLSVTVQQVQADRLGSAARLAECFQCVVLLKGSGSVTAAPGLRPVINSSGNARLAGPGSGDVLAGWLAAGWSAQTIGDDIETDDLLQQAMDICAASAWVHGRAAEVPFPPNAANNEPASAWPVAHTASTRLPLRAAELIEAMRLVITTFPSNAGRP